MGKNESEPSGSERSVRKRRYDWFAHRTNQPTVLSREWDLATIEYREGDGTRLADLLETSGGVIPADALPLVARVLRTRRTKPLYSEEDKRLVMAAIEHQAKATPIGALAAKWNVSENSLDGLVHQRDSIWLRLRHLFARS